VHKGVRLRVSSFFGLSFSFLFCGFSFGFCLTVFFLPIFFFPLIRPRVFSHGADIRLLRSLSFLALRSPCSLPILPFFLSCSWRDPIPALIFFPFPHNLRCRIHRPASRSAPIHPAQFFLRTQFLFFSLARLSFKRGFFCAPLAHNFSHFLPRYAFLGLPFANTVRALIVRVGRGQGRGAGASA
jgi:hypothetical protein